jgi:hypothetical protein
MEPNIKGELVRERVRDLIAGSRRAAGTDATRTPPRRPAPQHEAGPWS